MTGAGVSRRRWSSWLVCVLLIIWAVLTSFPLVWIYLTSFKTKADAFALPPKWLFVPTLDNYAKALHAVPVVAYLTNSLVVTVGSTLLALALGVISAYALTRYDFAGRELFANSYLATRVLPSTVTVIPLFLMFKQMHLLDNPLSLLLTYTAYNLPLVTFMLVGYLAQVPRELEQAAEIDGCSRLGAFLRVILPLIRPGIAVTSVFALLASWNEFLYAITFMFNRMTLPVAVAMTMTDAGVDWGQASALAGMILVPVIAFTLLMSKHLVEGVTLGAMKG